MNKQTTAWILVVVGLVVAVLGLVADYIGIGGQAGMGYKQIIAIVIGVVLAIAGLLQARPRAEA